MDQGKELVEFFISELNRLVPNEKYWDYEDNSFQFLVEEFFPYISDLDWDIFTYEERKTFRLTENFVPCLYKTFPDKDLCIYNKFPFFCKACNKEILNKIKNMIFQKVRNWDYEPLSSISHEAVNMMSEEHKKDYRISIYYRIYPHKFNNLLLNYGDPCSIGIKYRANLCTLIEERYFNFLLECKKMELRSSAQSPIEKILLEEFLRRGYLYEKTTYPKKGNYLLCQVAIFKDSEEMIVDYYKQRESPFSPKEKFHKKPYTIMDFYIECIKKDHPGPKPSHKNVIAKWEKELHNWERNSIKKIAIYADGYDFHERTKIQAIRDRSIDRKLQASNYHVLRFTGSEIYNNVQRCVDEIESIICK